MGNQSLNKESDAVKLKELAALTFGSQAGQDFLDLIERLYGHRRSFTQNEPETTAFKEGQRDTALYMVQLGRKVT